MKLRFHVPEALIPGSTVELKGEEAHHAVRVARIRIGEEAELFDGNGTIVLARASGVARETVTFELDAPLSESRELPVRMTIAAALIQPERYEMVLQKGTELGATSFIPLLTERTEVREERIRGKRERWQRIVLEATKQSGRATIPSIVDPIPLERILQSAGTFVVFDADRDPAELPQMSGELTLLIGPEGGWSDAELDLAAASGAVFQKLGPRRLRAETAAIVAAARVAALCESWL